MSYPFPTFPLVNRVGVTNPYANIDARYGPWPTFNDALTGFSSGLRFVGLTVAVSSVGSGVVEYWYKDGIANNNLVLKQTPGGGGGGTDLATVTNYLSTNSVLISALTLNNTFSGLNTLAVSGNTVIDVNNSLPALKITQKGTGPAFYFEDAEGDNSPIVIDQFGTLCVGASSSFPSVITTRNAVFVSTSTGFKRIVEIRNHGTGATSFPEFRLVRTRTGDVNNLGLAGLSANDTLGVIQFNGGGQTGFRIDATNKVDSITGSPSGVRATFRTHVARIGTFNNTLVIDEDRVGINTPTPNEALTVVGNISSSQTIFSQEGNSQQWSTTFTTVQSNSANWPTAVLQLQNNTLPTTTHSIDASQFGTVYQAVSADQTYVLQIAPGSTITLFISGNHDSIKRHNVAFVSPTVYQFYITGAGQSNYFYTFKNHITKVTFTNPLSSVTPTPRLMGVGTAEVIRTDLNQNQGGLGFVQIETITGPTDFLLQEDGDRLVIRNFV